MVNPFNKESSIYYRLTEDSYFHLDPATTPFMNLGWWPAERIVEAQKALTYNFLSHTKASWPHEIQSVLKLLEIGPGWGGSLNAVKSLFPDVEYHGLNSSESQINYARRMSDGQPNTYYHHGFDEDSTVLSDVHFNAMIGIESLLHIRNKDAFFSRQHARGIRHISLAEIVVEEKKIIEANNLFRPSLDHTFSTNEYIQTLSQAGYSDINFLDVSIHVFDGWEKALKAIDEETFKSNRRVLRQFVEAYSSINIFAKLGKIKYLFIIASSHEK
jgi:hypothetical protein